MDPIPSFARVCSPNEHHSSSPGNARSDIGSFSDDVVDAVEAGIVIHDEAVLVSVLLWYASAGYPSNKQALVEWTCERCSNPLVKTFQPYRIMHDEADKLKVSALTSMS